MMTRNGLPTLPERAPSLKSLRILAAGKVEEPKLRTLRKVLRGEVLPEDVSGACEEWVRACYHYPPWVDRALEAANELLDGHWVEAISVEGDSYTARPRIVYVNQGDTYTATLLRVGGSWRVGSWGDALEALERRGVRFG